VGLLVAPCGAGAVIRPGRPGSISPPPSEPRADVSGIERAPNSEYIFNLFCSEDKLNQLKFTGTELTVYNPLGSQAIGAGPPAGTSSFPRAESMNRPGFADCVAESG